jgi:hypothetical protein
MGEPLIRQEELKRVAVLFDKVRALHKEAKTDNDAKLTGNFEKLIRKTLTDLTAVCGEDKAQLLDVHVIIGKFRLYQFAGDTLCKFIDAKDQRAGNLMREINGQLTKGFVSLAETAIGNKSEARALSTQLESVQRELESVLQAAETLERTIESLQQERDYANNAVTELKEQFEGQIALLTEENQQYLDKIIKLSKQSADHALTSVSPTKYSPSPKASPRLSFSTSSCKEISLRQLKEVIEEVYLSKAKADLRAKETMQPRETMEQHLISYLNNRYGLKRLTGDWSQTLTKSIAKYEGEDPDIATFAAILRNEVEEDFKGVADKLKQSVKEYMRHLFKSKFPYMSELNLKATLADKVVGTLEEQEWSEVLAFFYNQDDLEFLRGLINDLAQSKATPMRQVPFANFLKVLLDFQLTGQRQFMLPFVKKFRQADADGDGQLTLSQFKAFVALCGLPDCMEELAGKADPFSTGQVCFSVCVQVLGEVRTTQHLVEVSGESISLLQKIFLEENS